MAKLPKTFYVLSFLVFALMLTGCELRRTGDAVSDVSSPAGLPPTLAPLGAETDLVVEEATPIATIINVPPTATDTTLEDGQAAADPDESVGPTSNAVDLSGSNVVSGEAATEVSSITSDSPETFVPPVDQATAGDIVVQEAIVVNATTSDDLPLGGPVAANPPASQTAGDYNDGVVYSGSAYTVQGGDTLFNIASGFGTTVDAIAQANSLPSDVIYAGQVLAIPTDGGADYTSPAYEPALGQSQHLVAPGQTLYRIALQYNTTVDAIAGANAIPYPYLIQAGQPLVIPGPGEYAPPPPPAGGFSEQPYQDDSYDYSAPSFDGTHTVAPGETLYSISLLYGTSAEALSASNGLFNPNQIYVGQVLFLP